MKLLAIRKSGTRNRVLVTARILFAQKGYSSCSMREVALRAKVNEVTVFRLFGTKERLYADVLQEAAECSRIYETSSKDDNSSRSQSRKLRETARFLGDSVFVRLFLFGILEQPKITMKQLRIPLKNLYAQLSARTGSADVPTYSLKDEQALSKTKEALALFHQCAEKLIDERTTGKKTSLTKINQQSKTPWRPEKPDQKTGTEDAS